LAGRFSERNHFMKRILIIDDDAGIRAAIKAVLGNAYQVEEAASRAEGIKTIEKSRPDLVILDVMMETQDAGFELAREIKHSPVTARVKILMVTNVDKESGLDFKEHAGDKEWLPVDGYLAKPVEPAVLLAKVKELIGQ
jgi:CheY-like chemotaxis protein